MEILKVEICVNICDRPYFRSVGRFCRGLGTILNQESLLWTNVLIYGSNNIVV